LKSDSPLHHAAGCQILPMHDAAGSRISPLHHEAGVMSLIFAENHSIAFFYMQWKVKSFIILALQHAAGSQILLQHHPAGSQVKKNFGRLPRPLKEQSRKKSHLGNSFHSELLFPEQYFPHFLAKYASPVRYYQFIWCKESKTFSDFYHTSALLGDETKAV
jgi:hypothetical protein